MKYLITICLLFLCFLSFAQPKTIKHQVEKGETVTQIARKYQVTPYDIYRLNPDAQSSLAVDTILLIPVSEASKDPNNTNQPFFEHIVLNQETLYGISKKWGVSIESIEKNNPRIQENGGLKIGDVLKIPNNKSFEVDAFKTKFDTLFHIVKPKETPYGVAKQYGLKVQELYDLNPEAERFFNIDDKIIIKINREAQTVVLPEKIVTPEPVKNLYVVQAKETLYKLSTKFGCSEDDILALNPSLKEGLKAGDSIVIPPKSLNFYSSKRSVDLTKTLNIYKKNKDLMLLIPFNINKIEADSTAKIQDRLRKDQFLNMSLDFYSGALMAIDSAAKLGIQMKVRFLDSEETTNSSNIQAIIQENDFSNVGAIIGPFYPQNLSKTAQLLSNKKIPVFSPLRDMTSEVENGFETMVRTSFIRESMCQYLLKQKSPIFAAIDSKKGDTYNFLSTKQGVKMLPHGERGNILMDSLSKYLKPFETNYVILDSKKTSYILTVLNGLTRFSKDFDIKLVTLEKNEALDFEEISVKKLANLNLMYPSQFQDANFEVLNNFSANYKKKYNTMPSLFAIRGFDITLDLILRMSQNEDLYENLKESVSEHIYSKFDYTNSHLNIKNQGIYIQQYQDDLTIKTIEP